MHLQTWGFFKVNPEESGVPVEIYCDDSELSQLYEWTPRIAYRIPPENEIVDKKLESLYGMAAFVTVSDHPLVMDWGDTSVDIVVKLKDFVIKNKEILELVSDGRIDHEQFFKRLIKV